MPKPYLEYHTSKWEVYETERIDNMVDWIAGDVKAKLHEKLREGYGGWDDKENKIQIENSLFEHLDKSVHSDMNQWVDVIALAMFLYWQELMKNTEKDSTDEHR